MYEEPIHASDELFDVAEAAAFLRCSETKIYESFHKGLLPGNKSRPRPTDRLKLRFRRGDLIKLPGRLEGARKTTPQRLEVIRAREPTACAAADVADLLEELRDAVQEVTKLKVGLVPGCG
jgi:hypothetical protein